ncbi:MAG: hypothetical protein IJ806_09775 [Ruminococcus sp.]|nr:hypothetical protein [Ruminococcus sp.]
MHILTLAAAAVALFAYLFRILRIIKKVRSGEFVRLAAGVRVSMVFGFILNLCLAATTFLNALDERKEHFSAVNAGHIRVQDGFAFKMAALTQPAVFLMIAAACVVTMLIQRHIYIGSEGIYDGGVFTRCGELEYLNDERLLTIQKKKDGPNSGPRARPWIFEHSKADLSAAVDICEKYYSKAQTTAEFLDGFFDN